MKEAELLGQILKRMDILISLQLEAGGNEKMTEKIGQLTSLGLGPAEVGKIIGKPTNYVTGMLSAKKRRGKKAKTKAGAADA